MAAPNYYSQSSAKDVNGTPSAYPPPYQPPNLTQYQGAHQPIFYGAPPPFVVPEASRVNFTGAIILSCFVFWCCGIIFGLVAFILAMASQSSASSGDEKEAKEYLNSSYLLSGIGIVIGATVIIFFGALY